MGQSKISKLRISLEKRIKNHRRRNPKSTRDRGADREFPLRSRFMKLHLSTTRWRDEADARVFGGGGGGSTEPPLSRRKEPIDRDSELEIDRRRVIPLLFAFRCLLINSAVE